MRGINKMTLIGNLGNEPELRYLPDGKAVTRLRLATNEDWKERESGEVHEHVEWHSLECFGRLAEIACEFMHKGSRLYVEGRLRTTQWNDDNDVQRWTTTVRVYDLRMLDAKPEPAAAPVEIDDDDIPY